jgi:1-aminocyclopropane-1-carboxylate deaminase
VTREALDLATALRPRLPSPLRPVEDERFTRHGVRLLLKRDDLIHPDLPGNKWRKLAPNLRAARGRPLLTFGGAYSNHLRATAAAGRLLGFPTIGIVRGDELASRPLNPSLSQCAADGMRLVFVDRTTYREKDAPEVRERILSMASRHTGAVSGDFYVVPEGGSNALAAQGCAALGHELRDTGSSATEDVTDEATDEAADEAANDAIDVVAVACGTGGTLAGLAAGLGPGQRAIGFPVLKGGFLGDAIHALQYGAFDGPAGDWSLDERFAFGGYARTTPALDAFAADFEARHRLPVERVYVAKMLYGLTELAGEGAFPPGSTVAAVITGTATDTDTGTDTTGQGVSSR